MVLLPRRPLRTEDEFYLVFHSGGRPIHILAKGVRPSKGHIRTAQWNHEDHPIVFPTTQVLLFKRRIRGAGDIAHHGARA